MQLREVAAFVKYARSIYLFDTYPMLQIESGGPNTTLSSNFRRMTNGQA